MSRGNRRGRPRTRTDELDSGRAMPRRPSAGRSAVRRTAPQPDTLVSGARRPPPLLLAAPSRPQDARRHAPIGPSANRPADGNGAPEEERGSDPRACARGNYLPAPSERTSDGSLASRSANAGYPLPEKSLFRCQAPEGSRKIVATSASSWTRAPHLFSWRCRCVRRTLGGTPRWGPGGRASCGRSRPRRPLSLGRVWPLFITLPSTIMIDRIHRDVTKREVFPGPFRRITRRFGAPDRDP